MASLVACRNCEEQSVRAYNLSEGINSHDREGDALSAGWVAQGVLAVLMWSMLARFVWKTQDTRDVRENGKTSDIWT